MTGSDQKEVVNVVVVDLLSDPYPYEDLPGVAVDAKIALKS